MCLSKIDKTQSASDRELMGASHRFLEQFSKNPFAVIKIKEHGTKPVAVSATTEAGRAVYGANNIMSDTASAGEVASKSINAETPTTPPQSEKNYTGSDGCAVTSRSPSPALRPAFSVKTVTTKKPFKFSKSHTTSPATFFAPEKENHNSNTKRQIPRLRSLSRTPI